MVTDVEPRSTRTRAALLLLWLAATACERPGDKSAPPPPAIGSTPAASAPAAAPSAAAAPASASSEPAAPASAPAPAASGSGAPGAGEAPAVKLDLLNAGREPRTALRYKFKPGFTERVKIANGTALELEVAGEKIPSAQMPDVELVAALKVLSVLPDGSARRELSVQSVGLSEGGRLDPSLREQLTATLDTVKALKGRDQIDTRGRLTAIKLTAGKHDDAMLAQLLDQMQQAFSQMGAPFPEQPIGVGARWTVASTIVQQGMQVNQVATVELTELGDGKGRTAVRLKQIAPRGVVRPPGMPRDIRAELLGLTAKGEGAMAFDLTRTVPQGEIKTHAEIAIRTMAGGQKQDTQMVLDVRVRFEHLP